LVLVLALAVVYIARIVYFWRNGHDGVAGYWAMIHFIGTGFIISGGGVSV
jgi:hypothetical protein